MKTTILNWITILMVTIMSAGFVSCSNDDDDNSLDKTTNVQEKDGVLQVNIKTAGNFAALIGSTRKYQTGKLKVSGSINGDDFKCIRDMMTTAKGGRLEFLDMSDASIVAGGGYYLEDLYYPEDYKTQNNFISERMFEDCDALQELILPNSVVRISHYMFGGSFNSNVRSITIGRSTLGSIDNGYDEREDEVLGVLAWMPRLEEIIVHTDNPKFTSEKGIMYNKDKSILYNVPPMYKNNLSLPNSLQVIAGCAFCGYTASSIELPNSVKELENRAFAWSKIKTIDIGYVSEIGEDVFLNCDAENIILSPNITLIPNNTFRDCNNLKSITIPQSVLFIGLYAFNGCENLRNIYMENATPPRGTSDVKSCKDVFTWIEDYKSINLYVPKGSKSKYASTIPWSELNIIENS